MQLSRLCGETKKIYLSHLNCFVQDLSRVDLVNWIYYAPIYSNLRSYSFHINYTWSQREASQVPTIKLLILSEFKKLSLDTSKYWTICLIFFKWNGSIWERYIRINWAISKHKREKKNCLFGSCISIIVIIEIMNIAWQHEETYKNLTESRNWCNG